MQTQRKIKQELINKIPKAFEELQLDFEYFSILINSYLQIIECTFCFLSLHFVGEVKQMLGVMVCFEMLWSQWKN